MRRRSLALILALSLLGCRGTPEPEEGDTVPPYPWAAQAWRASMRTRLREARVKGSYDGVPLDRILREIAGQARVELWTDREVFEKAKDDLQVVRASLRGCTAEEALDAVLPPLGLAWTLRDGFVYVTDPGRVPPPTQTDDIADRILRANEEYRAFERRTTLQAALDRLAYKADYEDTPLATVLEDISERGQVPIRFDRPGLAPPRGAPGVKLHTVGEVRAMDVLARLLWEYGLGYRWRGAEIRVVPSEEAELSAKLEANDRLLATKRVTLSAEQSRLRDLAKMLEQAAGVPVLLDEATWYRQDTVTIKASDVELRDLLRLIRDEGRCGTLLLEGTLFFLTPSE